MEGLEDGRRAEDGGSAVEGEEVGGEGGVREWDIGGWWTVGPIVQGGGEWWYDYIVVVVDRWELCSRALSAPKFARRQFFLI